MAASELRDLQKRFCELKIAHIANTERRIEMNKHGVDPDAATPPRSNLDDFADVSEIMPSYTDPED